MQYSYSSEGHMKYSYSYCSDGAHSPVTGWLHSTGSCNVVPSVKDTQLQKGKVGESSGAHSPRDSKLDVKRSQPYSNNCSFGDLQKKKLKSSQIPIKKGLFRFRRLSDFPNSRFFGRFAAGFTQKQFFFVRTRTKKTLLCFKSCVWYQSSVHGCTQYTFPRLLHFVFLNYQFYRSRKKA